MIMLKKLLTTVLACCTLAFGGVAAAQEAPDALVKRISQEVLDTAKADKEIQAGNQKKVLELVESKILPYVDSQRMTALAAGRYWREATPEQKKRLSEEFRDLLIYTYSGAISQVRDQKMIFRPFRADPADTEVEVRTQVVQTRGEPIQLNYRLAKEDAGWKIYDVNVHGRLAGGVVQEQLCHRNRQERHRWPDQGLGRQEQAPGRRQPPSPPRIPDCRKPMFRPASPFNASTAKAIYQAGLAAIRAGQASIDLADLTTADSAAIAALIGWRRAAMQQGRALALINLPAGLQSLAALYGVAELLQDASAATAPQRADLPHH